MTSVLVHLCSFIPPGYRAHSSVLSSSCVSKVRRSGEQSLPYARARLYLGEANVLALLPEALTADVEAILADETGAVCADAATCSFDLVDDRLSWGEKLIVPSSSSLAVGPWARVPHALVRHGG